MPGFMLPGGDAVITMDADLQHPPQLIPKMIDAWLNGATVVDAVKQHREKEGWLVQARANLFNSVFSSIVGIDLQNASDFKLLDRIVVDTVANEIQEYHRFYRGPV